MKSEEAINSEAGYFCQLTLTQPVRHSKNPMTSLHEEDEKISRSEISKKEASLRKRLARNKKKVQKMVYLFEKGIKQHNQNQDFAEYYNNPEERLTRWALKELLAEEAEDEETFEMRQPVIEVLYTCMDVVDYCSDCDDMHYSFLCEYH